MVDREDSASLPPLTEEELAQTARRIRLRQAAERLHEAPPDDRTTKDEFLERYEAKP